MNKGLVFGAETKFFKQEGVITSFVDLDYAGCLDFRKSLTGYIFTAFGTTISWKANLQKVVALSSTEAEYMALIEAIKEALWLFGLVKELKVNQQHISVYCDNQGAMLLSNNQVIHERTKHIDVRLHFVRDILAEGNIIVKKVATEENPTNMITKPLPSSKFEYCLELVGLLKD